MINIISQKLTPFVITTSDISPGLKGDVWELVLHAGPVVKGVILILLLLSVCCWGIIILKFLLFRAAFKESEAFLNLFWESPQISQTFQEAKKLQQSPLAEIFRSGYIELQKTRDKKKNNSSRADNLSEAALVRPRRFGIGAVRRALEQAAVSEQSRLEKHLSLLATTGSTAPFIGLFGTVWGIMDAFQQIGIRGSADLATVAPGISEALIATAFGLLAAIPAVIAYNYYLNKIRILSSEMDNFSLEFLNITERYFEAIDAPRAGAGP